MTGSKRIRVMYVVPDLGVGGAERHVTKLMPNLDRSRFDAAVVCIGAEGKLFGDLAASGTRAVALHRSKRQAVRALRDLMREMRNFAPDVVITRGLQRRDARAHRGLADTRAAQCCLGS